MICEHCGKDDVKNMGAHLRFCEQNPENTTDARERSENTSERLPRRKRVPMGVNSLKMDAKAPKGYVGRWFNDNWSKDPDRINRALEAGYEFVTRDKAGKIGTAGEDSNQNMGGRVSRRVGTNDDGSAITGYFMAIKQEYYDEDQALKQAEIDKVDAQIHKGKYEANQNDKRYTPSEGIRMDVET